MDLSRRQLLGGLAAPALMQRSAGKPNLVLILSDDHSVPYLGCYGHTAVRTPNLDRFASEGIKLDRCYTAAPQCVPSRTAIMTGRSPVSARMGRFTSPLPPDVVSLPELLRDAGYFTGVCGRSFHLDGKRGDVSTPILERHGLQTWDKRVDYLDRASGAPQTATKINEFFDKRPAEKPFFLWVNYSDPHHVWDANAVDPPIDPAKVPVPAHLPDLPGVRNDLARYCGEVSRMDGQFQLTLDTIRKRAGMDNTMVVFMGDNGMAFPNGKGSLYEPGLNVPLLARWTGRIKPNGASHALMSGEDIPPTFLEAAGVAKPKSMTGVSQMPVFLGQAASVRDKVYAARLCHCGGPLTETTKANNWDQSRSVRTARYKLIYNAMPNQEYWPIDSANDPGWQDILAAHNAGKLAPQFERAYFTRPRPIWELYDMEADPAELNNIADRADLAEVRRELTVAMQEKMMIDYDFLPPAVRD